MILKYYYEQKKAAISSLINEQQQVADVALFSDSVFTDTNYQFPLILFKYNDVAWNTSSEKEYKAEVNFSVCVVLAPSQNDYLQAFDLAKKIDEAILLHPNKREIRQNIVDITANKETIPLITNASIKVREGQYTVEDDFWEKSNYFIWEINYKTTLIEKEYKKRYTMITNGAFTESQIQTEEQKVRDKLIALGYDLDDYYLEERDGKKLLIYKDVEEKIVTNKGE